MILFYQAYDALIPTFKNFPITITISPCMPMYSLTCVQKVSWSLTLLMGVN